MSYAARPSLLAVSSRGSPIYSACLSIRAVLRTPAVSAAANDCSFTAVSGLHLLCRGSAPLSPALLGQREQRNEAAKLRFMLTARVVASPAPARTFTTQLALSHVAVQERRLSLRWATVISHHRTFTGQTGSLYGLRAKIAKDSGDLSLYHFPALLPLTCFSCLPDPGKYQAFLSTVQTRSHGLIWQGLLAQAKVDSSA